MFVRCFRFSKKYVVFFVLVIFVFTSVFFYSLAVSSIDNSSAQSDKDCIKWVDFKVSYSALDDTAKLDIDSHNSSDGVCYNWIELLAYLACKYGGDFKKYKKSDLDSLVSKLKSRSVYGGFVF